MKRIAPSFFCGYGPITYLQIFLDNFHTQHVEGHQKFQGVEDFKCLNFLKDAVKLKWGIIFWKGTGGKGGGGGEGYKPKTLNHNVIEHCKSKWFGGMDVYWNKLQFYFVGK